MMCIDKKRQREIEDFYTACQTQRKHYKGDPKFPHPLYYFRKTSNSKTPLDLTSNFMSFPCRFVNYKIPTYTTRRDD